MKKDTEPKPYPYTLDQLQNFQNEIKEAGGVDELMLKKKALKQNGESTMIATYKDVEGYKEKYITGIYEPLRPYYNTDVPYVFWSFMYDALRKSDIKIT